MKRKVISVLLALVMILSMVPAQVFAVATGDGSVESPWQIGDTVTNDGSAEPEGVIVENAYWEREDFAASETQVCDKEEHDHAGCEEAEAVCTVEHECGDGSACVYAPAGYTCGMEAHAHDEGCVEVTDAYTLWTLKEEKQGPKLVEIPEEHDHAKRDAAAPLAVDDGLPIHYFLAAPSDIVNINGRYTNYGTVSNNRWPESYAVENIKQDPNWNRIKTEEGIRNVYDESIVTDYVAYWPGNDREAFEDFGTVTINGTTYSDTRYEIKWVTIAYRDNNTEREGLYCNQYGSANYEHIHIDGLLVEKIQPGDMKVYKSIPERAEAATTFHFTLEKMLQEDLLTPPEDEDAVDPSFDPLTLTATIARGETSAEIVGGDGISFGYYKLTENPSQNWVNDGIVLKDKNGNTDKEDTDTLYIAIAPNGDVLYSVEPDGTYLPMDRVEVQNTRKANTVTYQWKVFHLDGSVTDNLPASVGAFNKPNTVRNVAYGTNFVYNTGFHQGTSYHDYENGVLYTFHGWDTWSNSSTFGVDPSASGYHALDDGDTNASNNKTVPITADTWINGYWTASELPAADAYLMVHKDVVVESGDAQYVKDYLENTGRMYIMIDPGIDKDDDGDSQIDADYPGLTAEGGYMINVYQYEKPFIFTEENAKVPGYTRTVEVVVTGDNLTLIGTDGDEATVAIEEEYDPAQAPYNLGTVTYINTYTKKTGEAVTEYPELSIVKHAVDTGVQQPGATFTLYSDAGCTTPITSFTTGDDGTVDIDFAALLADTTGTYTAYLKETVAPAGYQLNTTVYTLTLTPSSKEELRDEEEYVTVTTYALSVTSTAAGSTGLIQEQSAEPKYRLNVYNNPIVGSVTVNKEAVGLSEEDKDLLEASLTIHGPITRDPQGQITDEGNSYLLFLNEENEWTDGESRLPIGEYLIHENMASVHGYTWDADNVDYGTLPTEDHDGLTAGVFAITADQTEIEVTITNSYEKWSAADFFIRKLSPTSARLAGATFQLYSNEACTEKVTDSDITTVATTGANGLAIFSGYTVPEGSTVVTYYLKETKAPAGYYLSDTVYKVEIKAVTGEDEEVTFEPKISIKSGDEWIEAPGFSNTDDGLNVTNVTVKGQITITKNMVGAPADLNSVTVYVEGPNRYGKEVTLTRDGQWTTTLTNLELGTYTITEEDAVAPGYDLVTTYTVGSTQTTDHATVVLAEEDPGYTESDFVAIGAATVTNTYTRRNETVENPTSLTVRKVDEDGTTPLAGASFTLTRERDGVKAIFVTGESGEVTFSFLSGVINDGQPVDGKYILVESRAPEGYVLSDTKWEITVTEDDGEVTIELDEDKNIFENIWDWIIGGITDGDKDYTFENNVLTVENRKMVGDLVITKAVVDPEGYYADAAYSFTLDCSDDSFDKTFTLKNGEHYTVEDVPYGTTYTLTEDTTGAAYTYVINDPGNGEIAAESTAVTVTNTYAYQENNPGLNLVKLDAETEEPIADVEFRVYYDADCTRYMNGGTTDENGEANIPFHYYDYSTYYMKEVEPAPGYYANDTVYVINAETVYTVKNAGTADAYTEKAQVLTISTLDKEGDAYVVENTPIKPVTITAIKEWNDGGYYARPEEVTATLFRDGEQYDNQTLNEDNGWTYTWEGAEYTDEYTWTVDEMDHNIPDGYTKTVAAAGDEGVYTFRITNTRAPKPIEITVTKAWEHKGGKTLPASIDVTLYQNDEAYETVTLSADNDWTYTWTGLTDVYEWSVDETEVPAGYEKEVSVDGYDFIITNTRIVQPIMVSVEKVWNDKNSKDRPDSVDVVLYCNGDAYETVTLSEDNDWSYSWDLTDEYDWTVDEEEIPDGYKKAVTHNGNSWTITNTLKNIPKTGDDAQLLGLGILGIVGVIGFCTCALVLFAPRKKKERR